MTVAGVLGWLLTYAVHSTLFIAGAVVLGRLVRDDSLRDIAWKAALLGGMLTASVAVGAGLRPLGGQWYAGDVIPFEGQTTSTAAAPSPFVSGGGPGLAVNVESGPDGTQPHADTARPTSDGKGLGPGLALVAGWVVTSVLLLLRQAVINIRFFRAIDDRAPLTDGPLVEMLAGLRRASGYRDPVRLSLSAACPTPVAVGTREICLPSRYASDLDAEQQRGGLAHELAHLKRRDPVWQLAAATVESIFFFQPLNQLVRRRLRDTAEHLSDDWAARATGSSAGIARCLSEIASWVGGARVPGHAVAMAEGGSRLLVRIRRLAGPRATRPAPSWQRGLAAVAPVGLVALFAPTISGQATPERPDLACLLSAVDTTIVSSAGLRTLRLKIPAGSVRVAGQADDAETRIISRRCASRPELFEALHLEVSRTPADLAIGFEQPTHLFSRTRGSVAEIHLTVEVPESIAVTAEGGMGAVQVSDVGALRLDTSLGDVQVVGVTGDVAVTSGVGDVFVGEVGGSVEIAADVGRIQAWRIAGDLTVKAGHTGSVEIANVEAGVVIEDGQAGDVAVSDVDGGLRVGHMAEGRLGVNNVSGRVVTGDPGAYRGRDDD